MNIKNVYEHVKLASKIILPTIVLALLIEGPVRTSKYIYRLPKASRACAQIVDEVRNAPLAQIVVRKNEDLDSIRKRAWSPNADLHELCNLSTFYGGISKPAQHYERNSWNRKVVLDNNKGSIFFAQDYEPSEGDMLYIPTKN